MVVRGLIQLGQGLVVIGAFVFAVKFSVFAFETVYSMFKEFAIYFLLAPGALFIAYIVGAGVSDYQAERRYGRGASTRKAA